MARRSLRATLERWAGLALVALALPASAQAASPAPEIRHVDLSRFPLVRLTAVVGTKARPSLSEDGRRALFVQERDLGSAEAVVLAVDNSESMAGLPLREAKRAAQGFLAQETGIATIDAVAFARNALPLTAPGASKPDVVHALSTMVSDSEPGTALYDAVVLSVRRLQRATSGARILILLTDGQDKGSRASLVDAVAAAQKANVVIYAIAAGRRASLDVLETLAKGTGGRLFDTTNVSKLTATYRSLGRELERTWQLSYLTQARPGDTVRLSVTAAGTAAAAQVRIPPGHDGRGLGVIPAPLARSGFVAALVVVIVALILAGAGIAGQTQGRRRDVARLLDPHVGVQGRRRAEERRFAQLGRLVDWAERSLADIPGSQRLERVVEQSGVRLRIGHLPFLAAACSIALGVIGTILAADAQVPILLMIVGFVAPFVVLRIVAIRRNQAFDRQLPDVLATIASTLRAGHGLRQAMRAIADDGTPPASQEFARVLTEERLGRPLHEAISAMRDRIGSADLDYVATAVNVQSQVGGSLAALFDTVSETVRERQRHVRKVRALTSMGRLSAVVLVLLPIALAALLTLINPGYMRPLYLTSTGRVLIGVSLTSMLIGSLILRRIVRVRF